jgi:hypothetical protein
MTAHTCVPPLQRLVKSLGEMAEAKTLYLRCEEIYAAVYGADHSETVDARKRAAACD